MTEKGSKRGVQSTPTVTPARAQRVQRSLLRWFRAHARELPWRTVPRDPYCVWVSEMMLQQTRVSKVVPYYERFVARFPDVRALAQADLQEVLHVWSGLGYYTRARHLHFSARAIVLRDHGRLPPSVSGLLSLPGVGAYTSAAVASIAFGVPVAAIDGNVRRVLSRLFAIRDVHDPKTARRVIELAQRLVASSDPGAFNEAMMELGATVCTRQSPACDCCPIRASCEAARSGTVDQFPSAQKRARPRSDQLVAAVVCCNRSVLLGCRQPWGLFGGLWEPPCFEVPLKPTHEAWIGAMGEQQPAGRIRHVLTHRVFDILVVRVCAPRRVRMRLAMLDRPYTQLRWARFDAVHTLALSSMARKVLACAIDGA